MDIKHLPQIPDETHRRYPFVDIDRATCSVYMRTYRDQSERSSGEFLRRLQRVAPMRINNVLTDNGSLFTDRFNTRTPTGRHLSYVPCVSLGIEHRLCPQRHPQTLPRTNCMVERLNGRISDLAKQTRFACTDDRDATLMQYQTTYHHYLPQSALNHEASSRR